MFHSVYFFSMSRISASTQFRDTRDFYILLIWIHLWTLVAHCRSVFLYLVFKILQETEFDWPGLVTNSPLGRGFHARFWAPCLVLSPSRWLGVGVVPQPRTVGLQRLLVPSLQNVKQIEKEENEIFYISTTTCSEWGSCYIYGISANSRACRFLAWKQQLAIICLSFCKNNNNNKKPIKPLLKAVNTKTCQRKWWELHCLNPFKSVWIKHFTQT